MVETKTSVLYMYWFDYVHCTSHSFDRLFVDDECEGTLPENTHVTFIVLAVILYDCNCLLIIIIIIIFGFGSHFVIELKGVHCTHTICTCSAGSSFYTPSVWCVHMYNVRMLFICNSSTYSHTHAYNAMMLTRTTTSYVIIIILNAHFG